VTGLAQHGSFSLVSKRASLRMIMIPRCPVWVGQRAPRGVDVVSLKKSRIWAGVTAGWASVSFWACAGSLRTGKLHSTASEHGHGGIPRIFIIYTWTIDWRVGGSAWIGNWYVDDGASVPTISGRPDHCTM
jgi:hypothetical protein